MPGSISGSAGDDTFMQFNRNYLFSHGKFLAATIPEPGTSGFMATGPAGIIGVIRRKRNCRSSV